MHDGYPFPSIAALHGEDPSGEEETLLPSALSSSESSRGASSTSSTSRASFEASARAAAECGAFAVHYHRAAETEQAGDLPWLDALAYGD